MKGQSALEYLMTYGWALLIIAIVAIALWRLGVFTPMTKEQVLKEFLYFTTGSFQLQNGTSFSIEITNTRVGSEANVTQVELDAPFGTFTATPNQIIPEDGTSVLTISDTTINCEPGKFYTVNVKISFLKRLPNGQWSTHTTTDDARLNVLCR